MDHGGVFSHPTHLVRKALESLTDIKIDNAEPPQKKVSGNASTLRWSALTIGFAKVN